MDECIDLLAGPIPPEIPGFTDFWYVDSGGFGDLWIGAQHGLEYYAVKVLHAGVEEIEHEAVAVMTQLRARHVPGLVPIADWGREPKGRKRVWYKMTHADAYSGLVGTENYKPDTAARRAEFDALFDAQQAIQLAQGVLTGLSHLHDSGLIHRDVCSPNIVRIKESWLLGDFSTVIREDHLNESRISFDNRPEFVPPEGILDKSADLYALGITLKLMLTGEPDGDVRAALAAETETKSRIRSGFADIIDKACAPRDARYETAERMMRDLDLIVAPPGSSIFRWSMIGVAVVWLVVMATVVPNYMRHHNAGKLYNEVTAVLDHHPMDHDLLEENLGRMATALLAQSLRWDQHAARDDFRVMRDRIKELLAADGLTIADPDWLNSFLNQGTSRDMWLTRPEWNRVRRGKQALVQLIHRLGPVKLENGVVSPSLLHWDMDGDWPQRLRPFESNSAVIDLRYLWDQTLSEEQIGHLWSDSMNLLQRSHLEGVHLNRAQLQGARIRDASFVGAEIIQARCQASLGLNVDFRFANLRESIFSCANLAQAKMEKATLKEAVMSGAQLGMADMRGVFAPNADFRLAVLMRADLEGAQLIKADFRGADLRDANFRGADLAGADFRGASLKGVQIDERTVLDGCLFGSWESDEALNKSVAEIVNLLSEAPISETLLNTLTSRLEDRARRSHDVVNSRESLMPAEDGGVVTE